MVRVTTVCAARIAYNRAMEFASKREIEKYNTNIITNLLVAKHTTFVSDVVTHGLKNDILWNDMSINIAYIIADVIDKTQWNHHDNDEDSDIDEQVDINDFSASLIQNILSWLPLDDNIVCQRVSIGFMFAAVHPGVSTKLYISDTATSKSCYSVNNTEEIISRYTGMDNIQYLSLDLYNIELFQRFDYLRCIDIKAHSFRCNAITFDHLETLSMVTTVEPTEFLGAIPSGNNILSLTIYGAITSHLIGLFIKCNKLRKLTLIIAQNDVDFIGDTQDLIDKMGDTQFADLQELEFKMENYWNLWHQVDIQLIVSLFGCIMDSISKPLEKLNLLNIDAAIYNMILHKNRFKKIVNLMVDYDITNNLRFILGKAMRSKPSPKLKSITIECNGNVREFITSLNVKQQKSMANIMDICETLLFSSFGETIEFNTKLFVMYFLCKWLRCQAIFDNEDDLISHVGDHTKDLNEEQKALVCMQCGLQNQYESSNKQHQQKVHNK